MLNYINEGVYNKNESSLTEKLAETYLEIIVVEKRIAESRFHTKLASMYINSLFKLVPRETNSNEAMGKLNEAGLKLYNTFVKFCEDPNSNYDPSYLLD